MRSAAHEAREWAISPHRRFGTEDPENEVGDGGAKHLSLMLEVPNVASGTVRKDYWHRCSILGSGRRESTFRSRVLQGRKPNGGLGGNSGFMEGIAEAC